MSDLTKLTASEFLGEAEDGAWWAEIRRRLEELEQIKAVSRAKAIEDLHHNSAELIGREELLGRLAKAEADLQAARNRIDDDTETINHQCAKLGQLRGRLEKCEALVRKLAAITDEDCSCLLAFKERGLVDPICSYHDYKWAIDAARAAVEE